MPPDSSKLRRMAGLEAEAETEAERRVAMYGVTVGCPICEAAAARLGGFAQPHGRHVNPKACPCPTKPSDA